MNVRGLTFVGTSADARKPMAAFVPDGQIYELGGPAPTVG